MRVPPITPFLIGARVTVIDGGWGDEYGSVTKIGRRRVTVTLDGGRMIHVHPTALRRTPARAPGYHNFYI